MYAFFHSIGQGAMEIGHNAPLNLSFDVLVLLQQNQENVFIIIKIELILCNIISSK